MKVDIFIIPCVLFILMTNYVCNAIFCYKCDSITLEACAMSLNETELPFVDCHSELQCTMSIIDSITYRGCQANTPTIGATYKKSCSENLCNKGVYPPGRLKCHHCNPTDEQCIVKQASKPKPCRQHHEIDECYTEILDAKQVYRGCRSDTNHTVNMNFTQLCDINGCNDEAAVRSVKCVTCDSRNAVGCKMDLFEIYSKDCNISVYETCEINVLLTQNETCYTYQDLDHVVRGCSNSMPANIRMNMEKILLCNDSDFCNAKCLSQSRCLICDSVKDKYCRSSTEDHKSETCGSPEASSCFACEDNSFQVQRGCGLAPINSNTNRCYQCDGMEGCNNKTFTRCYKCSNDTNNVNCANWEIPNINVIDIEECSIPASACLTAVLPNGITVRGCESEQLFCNETMTNCHTCMGNFCNIGQYPTNRLRCYQCSDKLDEECTHAAPCIPQNLEPSNTHEACFEYIDSDKRVVRGCRSNTSEYLQCLFNSDSCTLCYEDGCNHKILSSPVKTMVRVNLI